MAGTDLRKVELAGVRWAASAAEAAAEAEVVFTSLPGPKEVEALAPRLGDAMQKGAAWFDLTTNSPACVRRVHAQLRSLGVEFLDAPVSGGKAGAQSGRLAIWVGGDQATYERFAPALRAIGDQPFYVGPIGAGSIAKLAHNAASFTVQTALAEIFTLGVKAGVVEKSGSWFSYDSQRIGQGRENAKAYLKEHPEVAAAIEAAIRAQAGLGGNSGGGIDLLDEDHEVAVD